MKELIGKVVIDKETGKDCMVLNATANSVEVFKTKNKEEGIDCSNWYERSWFERKFEIKREVTKA